MRLATFNLWSLDQPLDWSATHTGSSTFDAGTRHERAVEQRAGHAALASPGGVAAINVYSPTSAEAIA